MDISAILFLSCIQINLACLVYIASQGTKAIVWLFSFMKDDDKEENACHCSRCKNCEVIDD